MVTQTCPEVNTVEAVFWYRWSPIEVHISPARFKVRYEERRTGSGPRSLEAAA